MRRRSFLQGLLAVVGLGAAGAASPPAHARIVPKTESGFDPATPPAGGLLRQNGKPCRFVQVSHDIRAGQIVTTTTNVPIGMATVDMAAGSYGWVQISGPALIPYAVHG